MEIISKLRVVMLSLSFFVGLCFNKSLWANEKFQIGFGLVILIIIVCVTGFFLLKKNPELTRKSSKAATENTVLNVAMFDLIVTTRSLRHRKSCDKTYRLKKKHGGKIGP